MGTEVFSPLCTGMPRTRKRKPKKRVYSKNEFSSGDGMLTTVWGPSMWHYLHTVSFNYPVEPTDSDKRHYRDLILNMQHTLPCRYCRENLVKNLAAHPLKDCHMKDRANFSRYVYRLHEVVNKMLGKKSGLSYCDVRERYEHFRARCTKDKPKIFEFTKTRKRRESGCTEPLYGKKAKCVIQILPQEKKCETLQIDRKCVKRRG